MGFLPGGGGVLLHSSPPPKNKKKESVELAKEGVIVIIKYTFSNTCQTRGGLDNGVFFFFSFYVSIPIYLTYLSMLSPLGTRFASIERGCLSHV